MLGFALLAGLFFVLVATAGAGASGTLMDQRPNRHPSRDPAQRMSQAAVISLVVLAVLAIGVAVTLANKTAGGWWVLPLLAWLEIYTVMRNVAGNRAQRRIQAQQRKIREQAEAKRRELEGKAQRDRQRAREFGPGGVEMLDEADAAVKRISSTEAARTGWLGRPGALDFGTELALIADTLRKGTAIRKVMDESSAIAEADDAQMLKDAKRAVKQLGAAAHHRVKILSECADEARQIERILHDDRE